MTRGKDWQWADQDGGDVGTLTAIMSWYETPRSGANVSWNILRENNYRTGYLGKVSFWFGLLFIIIVVIVIIIIIIATVKMREEKQKSGTTKCIALNIAAFTGNKIQFM